MPPLSQSLFLQTLGYSIINSLWQYALLWLVYVLINTVLKLPPRQKYAAGYTLQAGGFVWFVVTFIIHFCRFSSSPEITFSLQKPLFAVNGNAATVRENIFAWLTKAEILLPYLSVLYLVLLVFIAARWIKAYSFTQSVRSGGLHETDNSWQLFVKQLSARLGIKPEVKIYLSEIVKTPLTIGFFKPIILIPLSGLNHLDTEQMEAVILHELAHIRRFDYFFNLFLALTETALFFNPFAVLISAHIKRERENCCDDWVLQYNYNAASYAGALLQIATCQSSSYLFMLKAADNKQLLLNRIKRMIEKKEKTFFNYRYQLLALFVMISILSSLTLMSPSHFSKKTAAPLVSYKAVVNAANAHANVLAINVVLPAADLPEKPVLSKKARLNKPLKENSARGFLLSNKTNKNKNAAGKQLPVNSEFLPAESTEVLFADNDLMAQGFEENLAQSNIELDKMLSENIHFKERQIALAKERFKKITANLLKENKAFFNQKQIYEQMKAAFAQIKAAQIQLELARHTISPGREGEAERFLQSFPVNTEEAKFINSKRRLETSKAEKPDNNVFDQDSVFYNYQWKQPEVIFNFPEKNKSHNFSYECAKKPTVKVVLTNRLKSCKKAEKLHNVSGEDTGEKDIFKTKIISPSMLQKPLPEVIAGGKSFYIISI